eukprot:GHRQ01027175.1.p4 GENE.GHRQ01027175.1~~GHRQ01027175.1.p4  ORF type:complete len:120 (-),score=34.45 GHRQ01027175.1:190-549(-)
MALMYCSSFSSSDLNPDGSAEQHDSAATQQRSTMQTSQTAAQHTKDGETATGGIDESSLYRLREAVTSCTACLAQLLLLQLHSQTSQMPPTQHTINLSCTGPLLKLKSLQLKETWSAGC